MTEHGICAKCKKSVDCSYADDRITGCKKFVLEPELELTNEEWFCGLSTEEKARFFASNKMLNFDYQMWIEWLKEIRK